MFAGQTTQPETWYAAFDVFALSSDTEQMPLSLLEAMAAGLPAACTDVGDVREMLSEANARFVSPLDDVQFAHALSGILDADFLALGAANRRKAASYYNDTQMFTAHGRLLGL